MSPSDRHAVERRLALSLISNDFFTRKIGRSFEPPSRASVAPAPIPRALHHSARACASGRAVVHEADHRPRAHEIQILQVLVQLRHGVDVLLGELAGVLAHELAHGLALEQGHLDRPAARGEAGEGHARGAAAGLGSVHLRGGLVHFLSRETDGGTSARRDEGRARVGRMGGGRAP